MRKVVNIGLKSGKTIGFQMLEEHVVEIEKLLFGDYAEADKFIDIQPFVIQEQMPVSIYRFLSSSIEMVVIGDIPKQSSGIATPQKPGGLVLPN